MVPFISKSRKLVNLAKLGPVEAGRAVAKKVRAPNKANEEIAHAGVLPVEKLYLRRKDELGKKRTIKLGRDGNRGTVIVGRWTYYGSTKFNGFHENDFLYIGSFCSIASDVQFMLCNGHHYPTRPSNYPIDKFFGTQDTPTHRNFTYVGNDVWIGAGVIVMPGVRIGNGAIIGSGSIVTRDVPDYTIFGGNPAKQIGERFTKDQQHLLQNTCWWQWKDDELVDRSDIFSGGVEKFIDYVEKNKLIRDKGVPAYYRQEIPEMFDSGIDVQELEKKVREFLCRDNLATRMYLHKTQSFENLMVWMAAFLEVRPKSILEFGTQTGCSSSLLAEMADYLGIKTKIVTINIADELVYRHPSVEYVIDDFTGRMAEVYKKWSPDIIFQDAHMYDLIEQQLQIGEKKYRKTVHLFHDVGFRLFQNPMQIPREAVPTSATGSWERHVLANMYSESLLGVSTRKFENNNVKIHIFDGCADSNEFGLGVLKFK